MITRAADYGRACEAKQDLENKITVKEQAAKRARESIEKQQKKLKDAELEIKRLKTDFVKLHGEVDAKKRKLEEEMAVVIATRKFIISKMNSTCLFSTTAACDRGEPRRSCQLSSEKTRQN